MQLRYARCRRPKSREQRAETPATRPGVETGPLGGRSREYGEFSFTKILVSAGGLFSGQDRPSGPEIVQRVALALLERFQIAHESLFGAQRFYAADPVRRRSSISAQRSNNSLPNFRKIDQVPDARNAASRRTFSRRALATSFRVFSPMPKSPDDRSHEVQELVGVTPVARLACRSRSRFLRSICLADSGDEVSFVFEESNRGSLARAVRRAGVRAYIEIRFIDDSGSTNGLNGCKIPSDHHRSRL